MDPPGNPHPARSCVASGRWYRRQRVLWYLLRSVPRRAGVAPTAYAERGPPSPFSESPRLDREGGHRHTLHSRSHADDCVLHVWLQFRSRAEQMPRTWPTCTHGAIVSSAVGSHVVGVGSARRKYHDTRNKGVRPRWSRRRRARATREATELKVRRLEGRRRWYWSRPFARSRRRDRLPYVCAATLSRHRKEGYRRRVGNLHRCANFKFIYLIGCRTRLQWRSSSF